MDILKIAAQLVISDDAPMLTPVILHQQLLAMFDEGDDPIVEWDMGRTVNGARHQYDYERCCDLVIVNLTTQITSRFFRVTAMTESYDVVEFTCTFDQFGGGQG
jgi:hypothetical protein